MSQHTAVLSEHRAGPTARRTGVVLLGAVASGALAVGALSGAGAASATCLSVSGINLIGHDCTSTVGNIAVGIGTDAFASAKGGLFGTAFAVGTDAQAATLGAVFLGTAFAFGPGAEAEILGTDPVEFAGPAVGVLSIAVGNKTLAQAGLGFGDVAIGVGKPGPNTTPVGHGPSTPTLAAAFGNFSSGLAVGAGSVAEGGATTTTQPFKGIGVFNNAVVVGKGSGALAGVTAADVPTGNGKVSVALGNNKFKQH